MSKFVLKNRPKKPQAPTHVTYPVGNWISLSHFLECVEKFKNEWPDMNPAHIGVEAEHDDYEGARIYLEAPPASFGNYEEKIDKYRVEYKAYKAWQIKHKKEILKAKEEQKIKAAKHKLERTKDRLTKEMEEVDAKLEKA